MELPIFLLENYYRLPYRRKLLRQLSNLQMRLHFHVLQLCLQFADFLVLLLEKEVGFGVGEDSLFEVDYLSVPFHDLEFELFDVFGELFVDGLEMVDFLVFEVT